MVALPSLQHPTLEGIDIQEQPAPEPHQAVTDVPAVVKDEPSQSSHPELGIFSTEIVEWHEAGNQLCSTHFIHTPFD